MKKPAMFHQPPWLSGGMSLRPWEGGGGSSASHGSCRMNWIGFQCTEASMFSPMMTKPIEKKIVAIIPSVPK